MENFDYFVHNPILKVEYKQGSFTLNEKYQFNDEQQLISQIKGLELCKYRTFQYINQSLSSNLDKHLEILDEIVSTININSGSDLNFKCLYLDLSCWEYANTQNLIAFTNIISKLLEMNKNTQEIYINIEYWRDVQPQGFEYFFSVLKNFLKENELVGFYLNLYGWRRSEQQSLQQLGDIFENMKIYQLENFYLSISFWQNTEEACFKLLCQGLKKALKNAQKLRSFITNFNGLDLGDQSLLDYTEVMLELEKLNTLVILDFDFGMWNITDQSILLLSQTLIKIIQNQPLWSLRLSLSNCEELSPIFCRNIYQLLRLLIKKTICVYTYLEFENIEIADTEQNLFNTYMELFEMKKIHLEKLAILTIPALNKISQHYRKEIIWEVTKKVSAL